MGIKEFSKATLKISLAIFVAVIALACVAWGVFASRERAEKLEAQQYEVPRDWVVDVMRYLQLDVSARTKLVDGRLLMNVKVAGYPEYLSDPALMARNQQAQLIFVFEDADGFKVYEKAIKISDFSTTVDLQGKKVGLNHESDDYVGVSRYKSFSRASLRWTLQTALPAPSKKPASAAADRVSDHCAPSLSRAERLRRLAQHGIVRQTGPDTYAVGEHQVVFYSTYLGGDLLSCR